MYNPIKVLSISLSIMLLTGCSSKLDIITNEDITVEYGDRLDEVKILNSSKSSKDVKIFEIKKYDKEKLGIQKIEATFVDKNGKNSTDKEITINVKDTKKPEIDLKQKLINIGVGENVDLKSNIKSVKDPVNGELVYSDKKIKQDGYWIDKGKLDLTKAGEYKIVVYAIDNHGNMSEMQFQVIVAIQETIAKEPLPNSTPTQTPPANNNSNNTGNSTKPSTNNKPTDNGTPDKKPDNGGNVCTANGQWKGLGNSNYGSYSFDEADAYGEANCPEGYLYAVMSAHDICGKEAWTVHYEKLN